MNMLRISWNEMCDALRDKGILIFVLFVPLVYPLLYSYVYTNEVVRDVPAVAVDDSHSALSRRLLRQIDATPDISIVAHCNNMEEARQWLSRHEAYGIIHIPATLTTDLAHSEQCNIGLYCDMSSMLYYKALILGCNHVSLQLNRDLKVEYYIAGTTDRQEEISRMPIDYDYVALYNPQSGFASFLIPPVLMLIIQQTLLLGIGMSMGNQRERHLGSTIPFSRLYRRPSTIVIGRAIPYFMLYLLLGVYMFTCVTRWFTLPQLGHYADFTLFLIPFLLACIFLAMTLAFLVYRREDCIMLFVFLSVPMLFLSGVSWPGSNRPSQWKVLSWLFPSTFGMNGYVRITGMGARLSDVRTEYMALWLQAAVYFVTACLCYHLNILSMARRGRQVRDCQTA